MKKTELREIYKQKREGLTDEEIQSKSKVIADNLFSNFDFSVGRVVHCFLPANSKKEINTWFIINRLKQNHPEKIIVVPKCDFKTGGMGCCSLEETSVLKVNKWGIPEPENGIPIAEAAIDIVVLPLLAFDKQGNRIGYGKGFYDRFLSLCKPTVKKVGVSMFEPVDSIQDVEETDIPLNMAVTPFQVYYF